LLVSSVFKDYFLVIPGSGRYSRHHLLRHILSCLNFIINYMQLSLHLCLSVIKSLGNKVRLGSLNVLGTAYLGDGSRRLLAVLIFHMVGALIECIQHESKFVCLQLFEHLLLFLHEVFVLIQSVLMSIDKLRIVLNVSSHCYN
jgi:hypothetical protein